MRKIAVLSTACLFAIASGAAWAQRSAAPESVVVTGKNIPSGLSAFSLPDAADVQKVDAGFGNILDFPDHECPPTPMTAVVRYYVGSNDPKTGQREIVGEYDRVKDYPDAVAGIHLVSKPIGTMDGGCTRAQATFDAGTRKLIWYIWGGR